MTKIKLLLALALCLFAAPALAQVVPSVPVTLADRVQFAQSVTTQNLLSTGACTAASCVVAVAPGASSVGVTVSGTWTGTLTFQFSIDATNWTTTNAYLFPLGSTSPITSTTANGTWVLQYGGVGQLRVSASAAMTGTAVVTMEASAATVLMGMAAPAPNSLRASYTATAAITVPTAAASLGAVESPAAQAVRLRHLKVCLGPTALQTTAGERTLVLFRTTAASSGGSTQTPIIFDPGDAVFGGVFRITSITTTPAIGSVTAANALDSFTMFLPAAGTTAVPCVERFYDQGASLKAPLAAAGVANGLALGDLTGGAGGAGSYVVTADWTGEPN